VVRAEFIAVSSAELPGNPFARLSVPTVINAAGKMTALGGSAQSADVAAAQAAAAGTHVDLDRLRRAAGARVAEVCGAEAGCITTGAAAGICISVAAVLTGTDRSRIEALPDLIDGPREVLLQSGHDVNFGATVLQMIRVGGGRPVVAGTRDAVTPDDLQRAIGPATACLMYVQSHHCVQERRVSLASMIELAHTSGVPLIVDAAAEEDLRRYVAAGADLVTYSGGKAIGGPTSGFIVGRADLIEACERQGYGIARPMKVGKEQIMGLMAALDAFPQPSRHAVCERLFEALHALPGLQVTRVPDRAGRNIERIGVAAGERPFAPAALVRFLAEGAPSIRTRNHQLGEGLVLFDPRELRESHVPFIRDRVAAFLAGLDKSPER
jgi:D-glucosaminate-6-phosphate ammonia-lyase